MPTFKRVECGCCCSLRLLGRLDAIRAAKSTPQYVVPAVRAATIAVVTNDGRNIVGVLRGYDQATNMILDECHERVYSMQARIGGWSCSNCLCDASVTSTSRYLCVCSKSWHQTKSLRAAACQDGARAGSIILSPPSWWKPRRGMRNPRGLGTSLGQH